MFVGGPIKSGFRDGTFDQDLRARIVALLDAIRRAGGEVLSAHEAEGFAVLPPGMDHNVVARDFEWMAACDVYVCLFPLDAGGGAYPSIGSGVEIGWATQLNKPVIVLVELAKLNRYSPFLHQLPYVFDVRLLDITAAIGDPARFMKSVADACRVGQV